MEAIDLESVAQRVATKFPREVNKNIQYGTAGFRTKGDELSHVICRMGLLAVLRSKVKQGASIGVMITASHNPAEDNGVKLVDPHGEMLALSWESHATTLANVPDEELGAALASIVAAEKVSLDQAARVYFARDTRPSGVPLSFALQHGVESLQGMCVNYGVLTTPQLHYMVRCSNTGGAYGRDTEEGYYQKLATAFTKLHTGVTVRGEYSSELYVDAANGVGAPKLILLCDYLGQTVTLNVCNDGSTGRLNHKCGADYVKVNQCAPEGMRLVPGMKCVSYDGDADRLVYFCLDQDNVFHLLDGDRIATLIAGHLQELVRKSGLSLELGLVQTAYANGASTRYISETLKVPVACVATGVKHLHHRAQDFDIGIYFEANGHGTVLFSDQAVHAVQKAAADNSSPDDQGNSAGCLMNTIDLINQTVGDAMSDMLLVEVILHHRGWSIDNWQACYTDLPNRQTKVKVKDRTVIRTTVDERHATSPDGLQQAIDQLVQLYNSARSFVRSSGTEDIVRVYAEADTQANADLLAHKVSLVVYDHAGGIGDRPAPL